MFTDGVTEAMNSEQALFSDDRLLECLQQIPTSCLKELLGSTHDKLMEFANGFPQSDDITMLALRFLGKH